MKKQLVSFLIVLLLVMGVANLRADSIGGGSAGGGASPIIIACGSIADGGTCTPNLATCSIAAPCIITATLLGSATFNNPTNIPGTTSQPAFVEVDVIDQGFGPISWGTAYTAYSGAANRNLSLGSASTGGSAVSTLVSPNNTDANAYWTTIFRANGTSLQLLVSTQIVDVQAAYVGQLGASGISINGDNTVTAMPRETLFFDEGSETALTSNESLGTYKVGGSGITIENIILDVKKSPTCSVSEQITCYDCGSSAGACTSGQTSTIMNAITIASGATRQSISESINTAAVSEGEYISCLITAGTCTVSDNSIAMIARSR